MTLGYFLAADSNLLYVATRSLDLGASSFDLYFNRALCLLKLGDLGLAMEDLRAALEIEPTHRRAEEARELLQSGGSAGGTSTDDRFRFGDL